VVWPGLTLRTVLNRKEYVGEEPVDPTNAMERRSILLWIEGGVGCVLKVRVTSVRMNSGALPSQ